MARIQSKKFPIKNAAMPGKSGSEIQSRLDGKQGNNNFFLNQAASICSKWNVPHGVKSALTSIHLVAMLVQHNYIAQMREDRRDTDSSFEWTSIIDFIPHRFNSSRPPYTYTKYTCMYIFHPHKFYLVRILVALDANKPQHHQTSSLCYLGCVYIGI